MRTVLALAFILGASLAAPDVVGTWNGTLNAGGQKIPLVVHLKKADGGLKATMDSPAQGVKGISVSKASFDGKTLTLALPNLGASYAGTLQEDGTIVGTFSQGGGQLPLTLKRGKAAGPKRPQLPRKPYPYVSEDVVFHHDEQGFLLAGTFTKPKGDGPFPAVVLCSGSGPQDRDSTIAGHKPFLVLADHLTRAGIAVLRVDDRGVGKSTGLFAGATTRDFATDAVAALKYVKSRADINARRVGIIGHSEGSNVGLIAASEKKNGVAFLVLLGGPGVPGRDVILHQRDLIAAMAGETPELAKLNRRVQSGLYDILAREKDNAKALPAMRKFVEAEIPNAAQRRALGYGNAMYSQISDVWFREFLTLDPRPYARKVKAPVLALTGSKDLQVDAKQNLPELKAALANVKTETRPNLNHLFQTCRTGAPVEYGTIEETFEPATMKIIADWIKAQK